MQTSVPPVAQRCSTDINLRINLLIYLVALIQASVSGNNWLSESNMRIFLIIIVAVNNLNMDLLIQHFYIVR